MSCCNDPVERHDGNTIICSNCYSILDDLEFEEPYLKYTENHDQRQKKFEKILWSKDLPWWLKQTLLDFFPNVNRQFSQEKNRVNFINLEQLGYSLLKIIGETEHMKQFKKLKTASRIKAVDQFVQRCFNKSTGPTGYTLMKLCDVPMISLKSAGEIPPHILEKLPKDDHVFIG